MLYKIYQVRKFRDTQLLCCITILPSRSRARSIEVILPTELYCCVLGLTYNSMNYQNYISTFKLSHLVYLYKQFQCFHRLVVDVVAIQCMHQCMLTFSKTRQVTKIFQYKMPSPQPCVLLEYIVCFTCELFELRN